MATLLEAIGTYEGALDGEVLDGVTLELLTRQADASSQTTLGRLVLALLLTDRRCDPDELPAGQDDPRGFWGDTYGGAVGSRLWLLQQRPTTDATARLAETYAVEALQPLVDAGMVSRVEASAELVAEQIRLTVVMHRPDGSRVAQSWTGLWEAQRAS